jgi:hypothetical protein
MPPGTPERLEQALAAWAALPEAGERAAAAAPARPWLIRAGSVGARGGLALVGWMLARGSAPVADQVPAPTLVPNTPVAVAPAPSVQPAPPVTARIAPEPEAPPPRASSASKRERRAPARAVADTRHGRDEAGSHGNLLEEARRLGAVRAALNTGDGAEARRELADYRARFTHGELALEADVLEADLLLFVGEPERARALANVLLARPDAGRYRQRLEQLRARAQSSELSSLQEHASPSGSDRTATHMNERR